MSHARRPSPEPSPPAAGSESLSIDAQEALRGFNRTPRPYHHEGEEVRQDQDTAASPSLLKSRVNELGRSGHGSSESGTEADDERPAAFVKALPAPTLRPRKGLKTGESNEDALLTPSQLDDEGRRLSEGYFKIKKDEKQPVRDEGAEQEKLLRRRLGELARRTSEVALMAVMVLCVLCGHGVLRAAVVWRWELLAHVVIMALLILAYPVKLSLVDTTAQHTKLWQRFRVPASFDPATVLYPPLLPVLVALLVSPTNQTVVLPNITLGLASLPQRLFPRSSRLCGINTVHWLVSTIPLILSEHPRLMPWVSSGKPYAVKEQGPITLTSETLVSLYPLHHTLLLPLHNLTKTSLLVSELHLLSAALINLLLLAASPQMMILKACLWVGGVSVLIFCTPVLQWNVTMARVPRWKLRRPGHTAEERKSLVDAVTDLINFQRATSRFRSSEQGDSDADEDSPQVSMKMQLPTALSKLRIHTRRLTMGNADARSAGLPVPLSAIEPRENGFLADYQPRTRRNTLPGRTSPLLIERETSRRRKPRTKLLWVLQLTPQQANRRKWLYAAYVYIAIAVTVMGPVRYYVQTKAVGNYEPIGWAISYLAGQILAVRSVIQHLNAQFWIPLPPPPTNLRHFARLAVPIAVEEIRSDFGSANVRLLLFAYWVVVIALGLATVFCLTAHVEVDTRRKVFHGVMVAVLLPTVFIDPCYCALGLALVLTVFLLLEVIRAGQVPPLGNAIGRFVAPYVDGRDLRGPVVVSHIFLLVGCAVPLWFSLASVTREGGRPWIDWEVAGAQREVAMIAGVVCVGMGDAAASLIGRRYGRHKWMWVGGKSLEGSAAFAVAVTVGLMAGKAWQVLGSWNDTVKPLEAHLGGAGGFAFVMAWCLSLGKACFCACAASFMEAVLTGANDNVVVPVALWLLVKGMRL